MKEVDFKLVISKDEDKLFKFTNADGTVYDMTGSSVICKFYKNPSSPDNISCSINVSTGVITVPFTSSLVDSNGVFEYLIEETTASSDIIPLVKGNITVLDYTPFSETIEAYLISELPANITLTENYRNQRIFYWRRILQDAFNISDSNLNIEEAWPILVNVLIAKLVVYDAMMLAAKGSFMAFLGGDYTISDSIGGPIRKIETGPANVEFHPISDSLKSVFQPGSSGVSSFDIMLKDLCGLSNKLEVKLNMCDGNKITVSSKYFKNNDWDYPTLNDIDNINNLQSS